MNILHNEQRLKEGCIKKRRKRIQRALEGEDIQNKKKKEWVKQEKMEEAVMGITVRESDGSANHHFALPNVEPLWQQNMFYSVIYYIQVHTR